MHHYNLFGIDDDMDDNGRVTVYLSECKGGIGMKVCGGYDEIGNHYGIFVKQILENGLVAKSDQISVGDKILHVNGYSLDVASQLEAVSYLRIAAQSGSVLLVLDKTEAAHKDYQIFLSKSGDVAMPSSVNSKLFPNGQRKGFLESITSSNNDDDKESWMLSDDHRSLDDRFSPEECFEFENGKYRDNLSPKTKRMLSIDSGLQSSSPFFSPGISEKNLHQSQVSTIVLKHKKSLGISLTGGTNQPDGPNIYISNIIAGGDAYEDGHLHIGDMLVSVEGESLVDVTLEQAKSILSRLKLKKDIHTYTISFINKSRVQMICDDHIDMNNNNQAKTLPRIPQSPLTHSTHLSLSQLKKLPSTLDDPTCFQVVGSPVSGNDPLLEELLHVMANIEDSEMGSEIHENVANKITSSSPANISPLFKLTKDQVSTPRNTISHYLKEDWILSEKHDSKKRKPNFSLDPSTPVKLEKLEAALEHLGLKPTLAEKNKIRIYLKSSMDGEVLYGDFVEAAKEVFNLTELDDYSKTLLLDTTKFSSKSPDQIAVFGSSNMSYRDDIHRLRRERDEALKDVQYFRSSLIDKDRTCVDLQDELLRAKQEIALLRNESHAIRKQAQRNIQSHRTGTHYEEMIRKLETEIAILQANQGLPEGEFEDVQKRLVVLGCQLRKSEVSKRTYEVAVDKLTKFVENIHVTLDALEKKADTSRRRMKYSKLSHAARETVKSVKMLLEEEPLPFGWEEVYASNGTCYYMNHVTQTTSWIHPVSGVKHSSPTKNK